MPVPPYTGRPSTAQDPDLSHPPKVEFYDKLKINRKFGMNNYALIERPNSDSDPAIYRFATSEDPTTILLHNLVYGATQGLSKNVYKMYHNIMIVFKDMSHKEALEYCGSHKSLEGWTAILNRS